MSDHGYSISVARLRSKRVRWTSQQGELTVENEALVQGVEPFLSWEEVSGRGDPKQRYCLYRLCVCDECFGLGKYSATLAKPDPFGRTKREGTRCESCRGEGRQLQEVATCATEAAVGLTLVTNAREGMWEECPAGLLDRMPDCPMCERSGRDDEGHACPACKGTGIKPTGDWLLLPWLPSARNISDAGRQLSKHGARKRRLASS